jgi:hypothetical protein
MSERIQFFKWSLGATLLAIAAASVYRNLEAAAVVAVLIALEVSISFDNAVVNATVLRRMSAFWQRMFLTVGIVIAVFGMRLVFPIAIVALATKLGFWEVANQALTDKSAYASNVEKAAPIIGAFGGTFLLLVALNFFLDPDRDLHWIKPVEASLGKAGYITGMPVMVTAAVLLAVSQLVSASAERDVLVAGLAGMLVFMVIRGVSDLLLERQSGDGKATGAAGLAAFLYLEMLDASFSLDGVLGAFAITRDIVLVALGLGVGALFVRSLTVYMVRRQTLQEYLYLRHGAHWAIGALAAILFVSIETHVPEWLTAAIGLSAILAAFTSSIHHNRRHRR